MKDKKIHFMKGTEYGDIPEYKWNDNVTNSLPIKEDHRSDWYRYYMPMFFSSLFKLNKRRNKMNKFWEKVSKCEHKNMSPDYHEFITCGVEYSSGNEQHCLDCGVYISKCDAMCCDGMSGWSYQRRLRAGKY